MYRAQRDDVFVNKSALRSITIFVQILYSKCNMFLKATIGSDLHRSRMCYN